MARRITALLCAAFMIASFGAVKGFASDNDIADEPVYGEGDVYEEAAPSVTVEMGVGESADLLSLVPEEIDTSDISVIVDSQGIITVSEDFVINAQSVGDASIEIIDNTEQKTIFVVNLSVKNAPTKVNIILTKVSIGIGETCRLSCSYPEGEMSHSVTYTSSNTAVATVDKATGAVTGKSLGTAVITATAYNGTTATCTVTVKKAPTSLGMNLTKTTIGIGESCDLDGKLSNGEVSKVIRYSSSDTSVATVSEVTGIVTGQSVGTAVITASTYNGKTATCVVTVKNAPTTLGINVASTALGIGEKCDLDAKFADGEISKVVRYTSSDPSVATVEGVTGIVTAKSVGTTVITATSYNGLTVTSTITVKRAPTKLGMNLSSATLGVGEKCDLDAAFLSGEAAKVITYTSSNTAVATVNKYNGIVTAKSVGTTVITAKTFNGKTATCTITVKKAPSGFSLNQTKLTLLTGESFDINVKFLNGEAAKVVNYTSSNPDVAVVNKYTGVVTAKGVGTATITARLYNGKTAVCSVVVVAQKNASTVKGSVIKSEPSWSGATLATFGSGAKLNKLEVSGRWVKVEYNGTVGYVYNKAFTGKASYSSITTATLDAVADDWLFDNGTDIKTIYDYVYGIYYNSSATKATIEEMCVFTFKTQTGACYHHAAMFKYLLERVGYEVYYVEGTTVSTAVHAWTLVKTASGWRHYDPTMFVNREKLYGVTDAKASQYLIWDREEYPAAN